MSTYKIEKFDKKMQALYSLQELFLYLTVKLPSKISFQNDFLRDFTRKGSSDLLTNKAY